MMVTKAVEETNSRKQATKASTSRAKGEVDLSKVEEKMRSYENEVSEMEDDALVMIQAQDTAKEG
jgi:hypothetical protein